MNQGVNSLKPTHIFDLEKNLSWFDKSNQNVKTKVGENVFPIILWVPVLYTVQYLHFYISESLYYDALCARHESIPQKQIIGLIE